MTRHRRIGKKLPARRGLRYIGAEHTATVRAWVAVHRRPGVATSYGVTFGSNYSRNAQFVSFAPMRPNRAEYMAIQWELQSVLGDPQLTVACCTQQGHVTMSIRSPQMSRVDSDNEPVQGASLSPYFCVIGTRRCAGSFWPRHQDTTQKSLGKEVVTSRAGASVVCPPPFWGCTRSISQCMVSDV